MGKPGKKAGNALAPPTKVARQVDSSKGHLRDQRTIKRLKMYTSKVVRNEKGDIVKGSVLSASDRVDQSMARVAPDRRWFGNTRVIGQQALQEFRTEMKAKYHDPYSVVVKQSKLPLSLLEEPKEKHAVRREMQWEATFGEKATRRRVRLGQTSIDAFADAAKSKGDTYDGTGESKDRNRVRTDYVDRTDCSNNRALFRKGMSNRIWNELYKVIDSADVIIYVLDARDPMGTRSRFVEEYMRSEKKYKHFVFVLNKCDLVPLWATARWLQLLSQEFPTIAFHASVNHPFGKGNLIGLLRQFSRLHNVATKGSKRAKAPISVGIIGYPNVGKSSVINTLRRKAVCKVAPIPGETKVWQYVSLTRSIFMIDCPGVVYDREGNDDIEAVLKGVVRVERLGAADKTDVIHRVFDIVKRRDVVSSYGVDGWTDANDFLTMLAKKRGKLQQGGVPDTDNVARSVLYDWQRGKIPWFVAPAFEDSSQEETAKQMNEELQLKEVEKMNDLQLNGDRIERGEGSSSDSDEDEEKTAAEVETPTATVDDDAAIAAAFEANEEVDGMDEVVDVVPKRRSELPKTGGRAGLNPSVDTAAFSTVASALAAKEAKEKKKRKHAKKETAQSTAAPVVSSSTGDEDAAWAEFLATMQ